MNEGDIKRQERIAGLIYAGGRGERMGGRDKAFVDFEGQPFVAHMSAALAPLVDEIFITRQKDQQDVSRWGRPVFDDEPDQGPYAGLVAAIHAARGYDYLLTAAIDGIRLPQNYGPKMLRASRPHAMAQSGNNTHPTYALIDLRQSEEIFDKFHKGERRLRAWANDENCGYAKFATDSFININQYGFHS